MAVAGITLLCQLVGEKGHVTGMFWPGSGEAVSEDREEQILKSSLLEMKLFPCVSGFKKDAKCTVFLPLLLPTQKLGRTLRFKGPL